MYGLIMCAPKKRAECDVHGAVLIRRSMPSTARVIGVISCLSVEWSCVSVSSLSRRCEVSCVGCGELVGLDHTTTRTSAARRGARDGRDALLIYICGPLDRVT